VDSRIWPLAVLSVRLGELPLSTRCGHSWSDNFSGIRYSVAVNNQGDKMTDKKSNESRRKLLKSIKAGSGAVVVEIHATTA